MNIEDVAAEASAQRNNLLKALKNVLGMIDLCGLGAVPPEWGPKIEKTIAHARETVNDCECH